MSRQFNTVTRKRREGQVQRPIPEQQGITTLNSRRDLEEYELKQKERQCGPLLLLWFVNLLGRDLKLKFNPENGDFGSCRFWNRDESNGHKLLPDDGLRYFEVGNLNRPGADKLPLDVRKDYDRSNKKSNTNRIIFNLTEDGFIDKVYATEHLNKKEFNPGATFYIDINFIYLQDEEELEADLNEAMKMPDVQPL